MSRTPDDVISVVAGARDEHGDRLEPEEQPAVRTVTVPIEARGDKTQSVVGSIPGQTQIITTAGMLAAKLRGNCTNCRHFDRTAFHAWKLKVESTPEGRKELLNLRANLVDTQSGAVRALSPDPDGDIDPDHALSVMGLCHALSGIANEEVIVHPLSNCPEQHAALFQPRDRAAERRGAKGYDKIMQMAEGGEE